MVGLLLFRVVMGSMMGFIVFGLAMGGLIWWGWLDCPWGEHGDVLVRFTMGRINGLGVGSMIGFMLVGLAI